MGTPESDREETGQPENAEILNSAPARNSDFVKKKITAHIFPFISQIFYVVILFFQIFAGIELHFMSRV
jgi:hypothetical protein